MRSVLKLTAILVVILVAVIVAMTVRGRWIVGSSEPERPAMGWCCMKEQGLCRPSSSGDACTALGGSLFASKKASCEFGCVSVPPPGNASGAQ